MKSVVDRTILLGIVSQNRISHVEAFEEANTEFRRRAIELMRQNLEAAERGDEVELRVELVKPFSQIKHYDQAIRMLELDSRAEIELEEDEFSSYVMDDWHWKLSWSASNKAYWSEGTRTKYQ